MDIVNRIADLFSAMGSNARDGLDYDSEASARAAIAAMFDWLEEPSEAALEYDSKSATDQRDAWLASRRAEALEALGGGVAANPNTCEMPEVAAMHYIEKLRGGHHPPLLSLDKHEDIV